MSSTAPSTTPSTAPSAAASASPSASASTSPSTAASTAPSTAASTPSPISSTPTATGPGTGREEGGFMGFIKKNSGMLIGGLIGGVLAMMTGGGALSMLMPIIGALLVGVLGDKNGMLSGVRDMIGLGGNTPPAPGGSGPAPAVSGPAAGAAVSVAPPSQPMSIAANAADVVVRNSTGVITSTGVNGQPSFAPPTGSGPAARGPDVQIVENAPLASGATAAQPAFRYTGHVEGNNFVITSVQAAIPGSNPPDFGLPSRPTPPVSLPIDANGKISFNQPAPTPPAAPTGLNAARNDALTQMNARNTGKNFNLTVGTGNEVSVQLDPVVRDGVTYQMTAIGNRAPDGTVTFTHATMNETSGAPPVTKPVTNPRTGGTEFRITNYLPPTRASATTPPTVTFTQGEVGTTSEAVIDFTLNGRKQLEAAQAVARGQRNNELVGAINAAPNANQAINALESTMSRQFTSSGMNPYDASTAAQNIAVFYAESDNRGPALNEASLRTQLQNVRRPALGGGTGDRLYSDDQVNAIVNEVKAHHTQIVAGLNNKPLQATPGASTPAPSTAAGQDIPRVAAPMAAPTAASSFTPTSAIPGLVPPSTLNPAR